MKSKIHVSLVATLIAAIGAFGFFETLEAAPKESQRLRGLEGRAFLVEAFALDDDGQVIGPNPPGGSYCYIFNSNTEWIDERFPESGTWQQNSVGAKTGYSASADAVFNFGTEDEPFLVPISIIQEGVVTPAKGSGVLQIEALTDILVFGGYFSTILAIGHEVDADECSLPPPDGN